MPTDFDELKRKLLQSDEEYRQLATEHHHLDEKIHDLTDPPLPLGTGTTRRSHPQKIEAAPQGSDGVDSAPVQPRQRGRSGRARLTSASFGLIFEGQTSRGRSSLGHRARSGPLFFPRLPG